MKRFFMTLRAILYPLGSLIFPCKIMDKDKYKKYARGEVLISNHLSWIDIVYMIVRVPGFKRYLSKKENSGSKLQHAFLRSVGVIFVDREKPELSSMRECLTALKNGESLSVFPEGTRNKTGRELQPFHSGAAMFALKGKVPVIPVVFHHKGRFFRRNYMGYGDPVYLDDLYSRRLDEEVLNEATERFRAAMQKTLYKLDRWVEEKGYKKDKKISRRNKRDLEKQYKAAKKEYARNTHCK